MAEEKPLTVKERMAALAKASGNSSAPSGSIGRCASNNTGSKSSNATKAVTAPGPRGGTRNPKGSVSERFAKLRRGNSSRETRDSGNAGGSTEQMGNSNSQAQALGLNRTVTPSSSFPVTQTRGPASSQATTGSSVAERIAMLRGASSSSSTQSLSTIKPPSSITPALASGTSNTNDATDSTAGKSSTESTIGQSVAARIQSLKADSSADVPSKPNGQHQQPPISAGLAARMQAMNMGSSLPGGSESAPPPVPTSVPPPIPFESPSISGGASGVSTSVLARAQAINGNTEDAVGVKSGAGDEADTSAPPAPPTASPSAQSGSRLSPALAARMQALGATPGAPSMAGRGSGGGVGSGSASAGAGASSEEKPKPGKVGGTGLLGRGKAIPLPGVMPSGGLSELRRRKEEAERAANEPSADSTSGSAPEPQPGELQHANLSRATIPQRRRPRHGARQFKPSAAVTAHVSQTQAPETTELEQPDQMHEELEETAGPDA